MFANDQLAAPHETPVSTTKTHGENSERPPDEATIDIRLPQSTEVDVDVRE